MARTTTASFSPTGARLATACAGPDCAGLSQATAVLLWDLDTGARHALDAGLENVRGLVFSSAGYLGVKADPTTGIGHATLYEPAKLERRGGGEFYCIQDLAFDRAGKTLAIPSCNGFITTIHGVSGAIVTRPEEDAHPAADHGISVDFTKDDKALFVRDEHGGLEVLRRDLSRQKTLALDEPILASEVALDGARAVVATTKQILVVSTSTLEKEASFTLPSTWFAADVGWLEGDRWVAAGSDGRLLVGGVSREGGPSEVAVPAAAGARLAVTPGPLGKLVAVTDDACGVYVADPQKAALAWKATLACERAHAAGSAVGEALFAAGGDRIAVAASGTLQVFDAATGSAVGPALVGVSSVALDPKSELVAAVTDRTVSLSRLSDGSLVTRLFLGADVASEAAALAWSPDGSMVAVAFGDVALVRTDGASLRLVAGEHEGKRVGAAIGESAFAGDPSLLACSPQKSVADDLVKRFFTERPKR